MAAQDFLLEIGTEEIPAKFMESALNQLQDLGHKILTEKRISFGKIEAYGTPRRLALYITALEEEQKELLEEVKGPSKKVAFNEAGEPTKAVLGFAKSQGVEVESLTVKELGGVEYVYALKKEIGAPTINLLPEIAVDLIKGLNFPKPMRWGHKEMRFARPIRWLVTLYGSEVIKIDLEGLSSDRFTFGHRFLSKGKIELNNPAEYLGKLKEAFVIADQKERKELIWQQVQELAKAEGGQVQFDEGLLEEITYILEYPTALCGSFKEAYLRLPKEVLVTPMREHQRYFPVTDAEGKLLNKFITLRNGTANHIEIVREGNEKVLSARLADAEFFYSEDLKANLEENVEKLKKIVFQESIGTLYEKVERVVKLSGYLANLAQVSEEVKKDIERTAFLAKADLVSNMVYEFPELQGIMGQEYALKAGEKPSIAKGILEHYLPRFAGDELPESEVGTIVSIADKMDTIVGCFAVGIQPTGSQDPYALRRQALGVTHIILKNNMSLSLQELISYTYEALEGKIKAKLSKEETIHQVNEFFLQRMKNILTDKGYRYDTIDAILTVGCDDLADTLKRAEALKTFKEESEFTALLTAFNRVNNLAQKAGNHMVDSKLFETPEEEEIYNQYQRVKAKVDSALENNNYLNLLQAVARLRPEIDAFFDSVMIMAENPAVKDNRLALLREISQLTKRVADLTKIVA